MIKKPLSLVAQKRAERKALVKLHYSSHTNEELAQMLGVKRCTILNDAVGMGLKKPYGFSLRRARAVARKNMVSWDENLCEIFDLMHPVMKNADVAALFGVSVHSIVNMAHRRGSSKAKTVPVSKTRTPAVKPAKPRAAMEPPDAERSNMKMKGPPPMNAAQLARFQSERFVYTPETLPWKARIMQGPAWVPPPLAHRGSNPI